MARVQISKEQWVIARRQWEGEPTASYAEIAEFLGTSRQAVSQRAIRESWQKTVDANAVAQKAHLAADSKVSYLAAQTPEQGAAVYLDPAEKADPGRSQMHPTLPAVPQGTAPEQAAQVVEQGAVDMRAQVIAQHRTELKWIRKKTYEVLKGAGIPDGGVSRSLKALAESMKVLQDAERKAYGLDGGEPNKPGSAPAVQLIVNRKKGVTVGR